MNTLMRNLKKDVEETGFKHVPTGWSYGRQHYTLLASSRRKVHKVPTLLVTQYSSTFPGPQKIIPEACCKPAMFKYSDKQQLVGLGSTVNSHSGVLGGAPATKSCLSYLQPRKRTWWQQLSWLFSSAETCLFEAKKLPSASLPSKFQVLAVDFQHYSGPRSFSRTSQVLKIFQ